MKVVIYTAVFNNYDQISDPLFTDPNVDFIYFSEEQQSDLNVWQYRKADKDLGCPKKNNRYHKMHPHKLFENDQYSHSIYLDSNIFLVSNGFINHILRLIEDKALIALVNHPSRYCCYQELEKLLSFKLISILEYKSTQKFLNLHFPTKNKGLFEANLIFRDHNSKRVQKFCEDWWLGFLSYCQRDQVLLPYYLQTHKLNPTLFFDSHSINTRNSMLTIFKLHMKSSVYFSEDLSDQSTNYMIPKVNLPLNKIYINRLRKFLGYDINIDAPRTYNEHICRLMGCSVGSFQTQLSDRLASKDYIKTLPFNIKVLQTLGVGDTLSDLLSQDLPDAFYLKANHSGDTWLIENKHVISDELKEAANNSIAEPYGLKSLEPNYINIPRFLFAEEVLDLNMIEYNVHTFNGEAKLIQVISKEDNHQTECFYDVEWKKLSFHLTHPVSSICIEKPDQFELMLEVASYIGQFFKFIRVDFYIKDNELYFSEFTFYPGAGVDKFSDIKYDYLLGQFF